MAITALPPAPSRARPTEFPAEADTFVAALSTFGTEANTLATDVNDKQAAASVSAASAAIRAGEATASAGTASTKATEASDSAAASAASASTASTQAGIATTKATEANNSAIAAAASAATIDLTAPGPIGGVTPAAGSFTSLSATGGLQIPKEVETAYGVDATGQGIGIYFNDAGDDLRIYNRTGEANIAKFGRLGGLSIAGGLSATGRVVSGGGYQGAGYVLGTNSVTTIQIASADTLNGTYYISAQGPNIEHKLILTVQAHAYSHANIVVVSEHVYGGISRLSNPRVVTDGGNLTRSLVIDVTGSEAIAYYFTGIGSHLNLAPSATPVGSIPVATSRTMTLDASGNLGLGVVPSAWTLKALQINNGALVAVGTETDVLNNVYYNGGWKYISNGVAMFYSQSNGANIWYTAPEGAAGQPISFTPVMWLDAASNLTVLGSITTQGEKVGYLNIPQNSQSANYTLALVDAGKHIFHPSADTTARTFTIPANASVAFPIGSACTFINQNAAGAVSISITSDVMRLSGAGTTGTRTLAANGVATAIKITATEWIISGTNLS